MSNCYCQLGFSEKFAMVNGTSTGGSFSSQFTVTTTSTSALNLKSTSDSTDHGADIFLIWVNPEVLLGQTELGKLQTELSTVDGQQMDLIEVTANQLKNGIPAEKLSPQLLCQPGNPSCISLPGLSSLTPNDIQQILGQDPFLAINSPAVPDPKRYAFVKSLPLENTGVTGGTTAPFSISETDADNQTVSLKF